MSDEDFYDAEIAPALLEIAKKCEQRGLPLLAIVEWVREPGEHAEDENDDPRMNGRTQVRFDKASAEMKAALRAYQGASSFAAFTVTSGR